ncbi:hypothetical protein MDMS009_244 [Methylophaga thiooxydans DMS010]|uniref:Uncharacterized protein n=1 Tax=Methylophaga thiooxydans DMS010 TaxID=637616 RepID=C0N1S6_9GAMM|nr:hypothetical protein MDMS009_244 [Methylophaga thiooxydans DMS010]
MPIAGCNEMIERGGYMRHFATYAKQILQSNSAKSILTILR